MKLRVIFKTPDAVDYAIENSGMNPDEKEAIYNKLCKWFKYGEYATIEVDTETDTATVVKINT